MLIDELSKHEDFVIMGAQVIAYGAYVAIEGLTGKKPLCFAVGNQNGKLRDGLNGNLPEIEGIPVKSIDEVSPDTFIVVAVTELVQKEVVPMLREKGYKDLFVLTQKEEHLLMSAYYNSIGKFPLLESLSDASGGEQTIDWTVSEKAAKDIDLVMYEVGNHRDNVLSSRPALKSYEVPIQAGATLSDKRIADVLDNTGINISDRNKKYCEMTASYWIWKNKTHGWKGIEHYRRHLLVRPELLDDRVDAVLPLPYICYPNELYQFRRFISEDVQTALFRGLKHIHPNEFDDYMKIMEGHYQYTYNMVCARDEVFNEYCRWFFEITEYIETLGKEFPEISETRALSYIAEVLTNIYFMTNKDGLNIYHVGKEIYV